MQYLADPAPQQTATPYDDSALKTAIDTLKANEAVDDATVTDLETLLKAKDTSIDQAIAQLSAKVDAIPSSTTGGSVTAIYDPLPIPALLVPATSMNGATVVTGVTGSQMVNQGKVHSLGRLSTPPAPNTWNGTLTIAPTLGACKLRWGITSALQGTTEVSIDGGAPITASNTGLGWSAVTPAIQVFTDSGFTWFEMAIGAAPSFQSVKVTIPSGRGLLPTLYAPDAITSLKPAFPTAMQLTDPVSGESLIFRPSELAKVSAIPTSFDPVPINTRLTALEGKQFTTVLNPAWFDTPFANKYTRNVSRATITALSLEYKRTDGTIQPVSVNDFLTGFTYSSFWNGPSDPNGVTTRITVGAEVVVLSWDGTGEKLTIAATNPAGSKSFQIRKVFVNGNPLDWFSVYDPTAIAL